MQSYLSSYFVVTFHEVFGKNKTSGMPLPSGVAVLIQSGYSSRCAKEPSATPTVVKKETAT